jgi:hypothetical protein
MRSIQTPNRELSRQLERLRRKTACNILLELRGGIVPVRFAVFGMAGAMQAPTIIEHCCGDRTLWTCHRCMN